jgi:hypothetical protein
MLCPCCGNEIPADDVNLDDLVARCPGCDEEFSFGQLPAPARWVPRPQRLTVVDDGDRRQIRRRWFTWGVLRGLVFLTVWDGFVVLWWYTNVFANASQGGEAARWAVLAGLITLPHLALGVGLTYVALCYLVDTTVAEVADGRLRVRHGPLPWTGNHDLDAAEVRRLYCTRMARQRRSGATSYRYTVDAVLADDRAVTLLEDVDDKATALFYEQQLEDWLGLKPGPVPGGVGR